MSGFVLNFVFFSFVRLIFVLDYLQCSVAACRFTELVKFSDEVDCPKVGEYFGELISSMVLPSAMNFTRIINIINSLPQEKDKRSALAQCLKFAAQRIDKNEIAININKALVSGLPWGNDDAFKDPNFLKSYEIDFITTEVPTSSATGNPARQWRDTSSHASSSDSSLSEHIDNCLRQMNLKELASICSQNSKSKDAEKYVKRIFMHGKSKQSHQ